mgnify:CR=1 FL=1
MKIKNSILVISTFLFSLTACEKEEVPVFTAQAGINFTAQKESTSPNYDPDDPKNFEYVSDFSGHYANGFYGHLYDTIYIKAKLEGQLSDKPLKVNLQYSSVEDYATPELIMLEDTIYPGEYLAKIKVICKRPADVDSTYRAKIIFDYENSDVVAGTMERQSIILSVSDKTPYSEMYVDSKEEWNDAYSSILGLFGEEKVRFIKSVFKGQTSTLYYYTIYYGDYNPQLGFAGKIETLREALDAYNAAHPEDKVREADGTLVTF